MSLLTNIWGYWKFDNDITDATGSRSPSLVGTLSYTTGKINYGAQFNATQAVDTNANFQVESSEWSVNFWARLSTTSGLGLDTIFAQGNSTETIQNSIDFNTTRLTFRSRATSDQNVFHLQNYYDDTWRMFTFVKTGTGSTGTITIYVNGTSVSSGTITNFNDRSNDFFIGRLGDSTLSAYTYRNKLDELGVWTRSLTSTEVTQLYNSGNGLPYPLNPNYELTADTGTFNLTGNNANLVKNSVQLVMTADTAQFNLTGYDAGSRFAYNIIPDTLEFNLTWEDIRVLAPTTFTVDTGNFIFTGNDAQLEYRIHNYLLTADRAEFFLTGNNAQFTGQKWQNITKTTQATFSNNSKSVPTYANISKNTETFTNIDKS